MNEEGLIASIPQFSTLMRVSLSLNETLPDLEENPQDRRETKGLYTISCKSFNPGKRRIVENKFIVSSDLFIKGTRRFKGWEDFCETAYNEIDPEYKAVRWLLNNTNIDKLLFDLVEQCENVGLPFSMNVKQYALKLARKTGEDKPRLEMLKDKNLLAVRKGSNNL